MSDVLVVLDDLVVSRFYDIAEVYNWHDRNNNDFKNNLRTMRLKMRQNLKNNQPRPKFTGSF